MRDAGVIKAVEHFCSLKVQFGRLEDMYKIHSLKGQHRVRMMVLFQPAVVVLLRQLRRN